MYHAAGRRSDIISFRQQRTLVAARESVKREVALMHHDVARGVYPSVGVHDKMPEQHNVFTTKCLNLVNMKDIYFLKYKYRRKI